MVLVGSEVVEKERVAKSDQKGVVLDSQRMDCTSKVLIFAFAFPPVAVAGTFRTLRFVRYLRCFSWNPLVLTIKPESLPEIPVDHNLNTWVPQEIPVVRTSVFRPISTIIARVSSVLKCRAPQMAENSCQTDQPVNMRKESAVRKFLRTLKKAIKLPSIVPDRHISWMIPALYSAVRTVRIHRPNVLYSSGPPHSSHLIAVLAKVFTGLPLVIDLRDPWANCDWQVDNGKIAAAMQRWFERYCVYRADAVILNTESLRQQFCRNYPTVTHSRFVAITNGYDPELRNQIESLQRDYYSANGNAGSISVFRLCHAGSVYGERKLQPLVAAVAQLNRSGYRIVLDQVGRVAEEHELHKFIEEQDAHDYVRLLGEQSHESALQCLATADALVILQPGTAIQIPGKLFEMLLFDKPILALTDTGETSALVIRYGLGAAIRPDDQLEITTEIKRLAEQGHQNSIDAGRWKALRDFDGSILTGKLAEVFDRLVKP